MPLVRLPDGTELQLPSPATPRDVATAIGPGLAKAALAAVIDEVTVGIDASLPDGENAVEVRLLTKKDPAALDVMRHSCAHVMARAIMRLYEGVRLAFGPTVEGGYYYDIDLDHSLSEDDFEAIEAEMARIVKLNEPFERIEQPRDKALQVCRDLQQTYKVEHIDDGLADHETLSFYQQGEFLDLCRGPHVPTAGAIGAFKILSVAGAYWKGDQNRKQLQRVYGTAFFNKQDLKDHLERIEEAKRRDHRVLGKRLEFFTINPEMVGSGLVLWQPKGAIIRNGLESFVRDELQMRGYQPVYTPNIGRIELYETSGHYPYYKDSMFSPITLEHEEQYLLKPMNCPHHTMIYKTRPRSYRELPLRLAEFGTVYRYEQSGELSGMTRVRGFTQDDAHIFCTSEQVPEEFRDCIEMTRMVLDTLGLASYRVRLGFRDPDSDKYIGEATNWQKAENALIEVCTDLGMEFTVERGEAAFYGPKADFVVTDCIGREWQLGTVQLDYNLPSDDRFGLQYIGADNQPHRPVMIHRAPLGSMERFIGVLIEHFAGAFPLWLAPEQVRVLSVSQKFEDYARRVEQQLRATKLRVGGDYRPEKIGAKIRDGQLELIPYMFIVGGREMESETVAVRDRLIGDLGPMKIDEALVKLQTEIAAREVRQSFGGNAGLGERGTGNQY
ncbi:MAG: threonine--tRNA ligase [Pirellulaceae bacterium]|jgi:threonyl-tRNA synthetase|nr:threonine--tRNA ligase [Planctomycetaceae bacterium]MDP6557353.1 threonine--tRNA ligase [Pirellulaceae bacterium]MDP6721075.1 threonine--tRNA ligase [Pirellulaceae bacterium]